MLLPCCCCWRSGVRCGAVALSPFFRALAFGRSLSTRQELKPAE